MKRSLLFAAAFLLPLTAFALSFTDSTSNYTDSSTFTTAERAGISVLTNIGAVQGNPDGTFAADRTLNRAEFTKIALLTMTS